MPKPAAQYAAHAERPKVDGPPATSRDPQPARPRIGREPPPRDRFAVPLPPTSGAPVPDSLDALRRCHGYLAVASDGPVGTVETPLFPPEADDPDYIVVRIQQGLRSRLPVVTAALVERVDPLRRLVYLRAPAAEIAGQPEHLPLAI